MLNNAAFYSLLELFEDSGYAMPGLHGEVADGIPRWQWLHTAAISNEIVEEWSESLGYVDHIRVVFDWEYDSSEVYAENGNYYYYHPETYERIEVDVTQLQCRVVKQDKLFHWVADQLDIPQAYRQAVHHSYLENRLWKLGKLRVGGLLLDVWIARHINSHYEYFMEFFADRNLPERGLILSCGRPLDSFIQRPRSYEVVSLCELVLEYETDTRLDMERLQRLLLSPAGAGNSKTADFPIEYDIYRKTLTIMTQPGEAWLLKGERQAAAVQYMVEQARQNRWLLPAAEILAAAYPDKRYGRSARMQNLFRGNPRWDEFIENPQKGKYRFRMAT